jgi:hypothetical protein
MTVLSLDAKKRPDPFFEKRIGFFSSGRCFSKKLRYGPHFLGHTKMNRSFAILPAKRCFSKKSRDKQAIPFYFTYELPP